ncbi:ATP12 family chaperone protein [Pseudoruegeria sp. SK021]|uniref:ATP12 family chaperone protein n=1 Tax=Pseudoruegeria sp. SK021 TaxID=1933035 RepID=UPI000A23DC4B|nr:ATP12 family protein [Pseudoruegeria sp. SK021]OSP55159.1 ATPase [Pseudoruegeria sp. SK021]
MFDAKRKRFWTAASARPESTGFGIFLDERPVKTPGKMPLVVPTESLGVAIAAEWDAQQDRIDPGAMPMTRMANTAIDKVRLRMPEVAEVVAEYGGCDLLCYRAEGPEELCARQQQAWDPLLDWSATVQGAPLNAAAGIVYVDQPPASVSKLAARVHAMSYWELVAFHDLVALSGSLVIALAAIDKVRPVSELWDLSCLDEHYQTEVWGEDTLALASAAIKATAFQDAYRFFEFVQI